ncbi:unnamed protein product [Nippostrongylus brasiliensis]|uniref:Craniofacial development protein 2-like n=1 Tax=Nippostrongylus brasiliensis TaxID=27835 RepID=A0A0N4XY72_NIPBR|nr:unnamed protein product [Nippostrongylus brasiliensis]
MGGGGQDAYEFAGALGGDAPGGAPPPPPAGAQPPRHRTGSTPSLTVFVVYAPTSHYNDEEVEAFHMELEKLYEEDYTFYKVIVGDFNAKIGP